MVCLHGIADTWRTWQLVLPALERHHDVLAPTLPGHAGGPPIDGDAGAALLGDAVERAMDEAGFATAHLVGNSLGGYLALQLASRGRADTVVALAPAGGWAPGDGSLRETLRLSAEVREAARAAVPHADAIAATAEGRRRATRLIVSSADGIPADLVAHLMRGAAGCDGLPAFNAAALRDGWALDAERIACPVRIVWGTADRLLPWPAAAARYRADLLPHADWVELDGVGHCPQLEVPLETGELILGVTAPGRSAIDAAPHGRA